jgi:hypothetical protein
MEEYLLQSIKLLLQLIIYLQEILKHFLYMEEYLLQSIKRLLQLIIHLQEYLSVSYIWKNICCKGLNFDN